MKNEEIYLRIRKRVKSRQYRGESPFGNYIQKVKRSERLWNLINKRIKDKSSLKEALTQFVISDITAFEVYFRDLFLALYNSSKDKTAFLMKCDKLMIDRRFDYQDLVTIKNEEIDLADIILEYQNFQKLGTIIKIFSMVLKEKFLEEINKKEFKFRDLENRETVYSIKLSNDWYTKLEEYLNLRHDLTHDFNPKLKLKFDDISNLHDNMINFVIAVDMIFYKDILNIDPMSFD